MKINNDTNALKPRGRKQTHKDLLDIGTLTHAQLEAQLREIIPQNYASISNGVTNGDAHDHNGGDGGQIDYNSLANQPTIINPPATTAANDVQVGNGAGAWITNTIAQFITTLRATLDSVYAAAAHSHAWGTITGTLASQTDLQTALNGKVDENAAIIGATKTKITYDAKGLVTSGADATTADIADSTNKRYVTDADLVDIGNLSGTNTGDQDLSGLQPLDADLTAIAGLAPANDDVIQRKAGAWINRTIAQLTTDIRAVIDSVYVALTGDQTVAGVKTFTSAPTIAPATPTNGTDFLLFTLERAWRIQQASTAGNSMLEFFSDTAGKYVRINPNSVNAGGLIVADTMPTGTRERFMVEGTGNIKGQVSTLSSTGYAFQRLKNDAGHTFDFGINGSARAETVFGLNNSTGGVGLSFAAPSSSPLAIGTLGAFDLYFGTNGVIRAQIDSSGNIYLGGSTTNAVKIAPGGELTLIGTATRWNDLRVEPVVRTTGAKAPTFTAYKTNVYLYDFDNAVLASEKEIFFTVQLPHDWKEGSTIYPHVHWVNRTTGTAGHVVKWAMDYTKAKIGATFGATSNISGTAIVGGGDITVADEHMVTSLTAITMTGDTISTVLVCRAYRNSSDAADTYTGTAGLLYVDFHYEIDSIGGSADEFTK